ncbi:hypothetical protein EBS80_01010 [bacterium]|nr:hypothetical protein [bacterium]
MSTEFPTPEEVEEARERKLKPVGEFATRLGQVLRTGEKHPGKDGWITINRFDHCDECDESIRLGPLPDDFAPDSPAWEHLKKLVGPRWEIALVDNQAKDPTDRRTDFKIRPKKAT